MAQEVGVDEVLDIGSIQLLEADIRLNLLSRVLRSG